MNRRDMRTLMNQCLSHHMDCTCDPCSVMYETLQLKTLEMEAVGIEQQMVNEGDRTEELIICDSCSEATDDFEWANGEKDRYCMACWLDHINEGKDRIGGF